MTLRALVELGLRQVIETGTRGGAFRLRKASFRGQGLQPAAKNINWGQMRELAYGERGRLIAIDTNILVYAYGEDSEWQEAGYARIVEVAEGRVPWATP